MTVDYLLIPPIGDNIASLLKLSRRNRVEKVIEYISVMCDPCTVIRGGVSQNCDKKEA
jgi:hypothetical protein